VAYAPMYEFWRRIEDSVPFDLALDLGRAEDYPLGGHPWFFGVRIPMTDQDEHGLPSPEELTRLDVVENRVREVVRERDALYVGRRTGAGNRDLLFYLPERPKAAEDRIRMTVGMEILFISRPDKTWVGYESLLPEAREWRQIEDRRGIQELLDMDLPPEEPYRLMHEVVTKSQKGAEALIGLFGKLELVECEFEGERPQVLVRGIQVTPLTFASIHRVAWILETKAPKALGSYLGWSLELP
jgi:hypothetical protein